MEKPWFSAPPGVAGPTGGVGRHQSANRHGPARLEDKRRLRRSRRLCRRLFGAPIGTPFAKKANDSQHEDVRAVLLYQPNDALSVKLQYMRFGGHQDYSQQMTSVDPAYFADWGMTPGYEELTNNLYSGSITYNFGFATLTSSTGYVNFHTAYLSGQLNPLLGSGTIYNAYDGYSFTEELRLASSGSGPFHWVVGAFSTTRKYNSLNIDFQLPIFNGTAATPTLTKNEAAFGEVSYDLFGGKLVPLAGIRFPTTTTGFLERRHRRSRSPGSGRLPTVTTWRANLEAIIPTNSATIYFNAGTGFRSGIVQSAVQVAALAFDHITEGQALQPDRMRNLEFGAKAILPQHVSAEFNLYDIRYNNIQSGLTTSTGIAAFASLGSAKIRESTSTCPGRQSEGSPSAHPET